MRLNIFINKNKYILIIFLLSLLIRIFYFLSVKPYDDNFVKEKFSVTDAKEYHLLAEKTIQDGKYPEWYFLDTFRTPVFPFYVVFLYLIFGIKPYIIFFSNIILNLISIAYLYLICKRVIENEKISLITVLLFSFEPNIIKMMTEYGPDTLHNTLLIASIYYLVSALKTKKYGLFLVSAVLFAITTLTRPVNLYFCILCGLFILFYPGEKIIYRIKTVFIFLVIYFLALTPWMYRNYRVYGYFSTSAYQGNAALYYACVTKAGVDKEDVFESFVNMENLFVKECKEKNVTNPFDIDRMKQKMGMEYILNHIDVYIPLHFKGMLNFFVAPLNNDKYSVNMRILLGIYFFVIYSLSLIGIYFMVKYKQYLYSISLISVVMYYSFLTGVVGLARYRLPSTAFFLIPAAFGLYYIAKNINDNYIKKKV